MQCRVKWFGAGWPSVRGSNNCQSKKTTGRHATKSAALVQQQDPRECVSNLESWCFRCNWWKNLDGRCGCQSLNLGPSQENLNRQHWLSFAQNTFLAQQLQLKSNNQVSMFQFPPPNHAVNQQTSNDTQTESAALGPNGGYTSEPWYEQVFPSSSVLPPPSSSVPPPPSSSVPPPPLSSVPPPPYSSVPSPPGSSSPTDTVHCVQGQDLSNTSEPTFESPVTTPALFKTHSDSVSAHRGISKWDVKTDGEQNTLKEGMGGRPA